ncbi:hypothetical protein [Corynebacterium flavescens]|uniref:hypothetical protein n=1 Tax=Corynebacterium flavescens TaxID=28028 RepID=UPI003FD6316D
MNVMILILFLLAGLLVGGTYSAYQAGSRFFSIVAGLLAVVSLAAALMWMVGKMNW